MAKTSPRKPSKIHKRVAAYNNDQYILIVTIIKTNVRDEDID